MKQNQIMMNVVKKTTICVNKTRLNIVKNASYFLKKKNNKSSFQSFGVQGLTFRNWNAPPHQNYMLDFEGKTLIYQNMHSSPDSIFLRNRLFCH